MDHAVIYHWWDEKSEKPYQSMISPVVLAIATLRRFNKEIPIYVIDISTRDWKLEDWDIFPKKLNFNIIKKNPLFMLKNAGKINSRMCSRIWDVWDIGNKIKQNKLISADTDIFWLKDVLPLEYEVDGEIEKFTSGSNSGIWYFDKNKETTQKLFKIWKAVTFSACCDKEFSAKLSKETVGNENYLIYEEKTLRYVFNRLPSLMNKISIRENFILHGLLNADKEAIDTIKNLHCLSCLCGDNRGKVCLLFKELDISEILNQEEIDMIFGDCKPTKRFSIYEINKEQNKDKIIEFCRALGVSPYSKFLLNRTLKMI